MLRHTFCHFPGIGSRTEQRMWDSGILCWDDLTEGLEGETKPPFRKAGSRIFKDNLRQSIVSLEKGDPRYFADLLPSEQQWRLFKDFRDDCAYLDIETTGMGGPGDHITTIALYDGKSIYHYIHGRNLNRFHEDVKRYRLLVTYNGKCFDLPFIRASLGIELSQAHIDLRYPLKSLGYRGGLKGCEKQLGIHRDDLDGVDGLFAVFLWDDYKRTGNVKALETLLAYNILDVVNLEALMVQVFNLKLKATPFHSSDELSVPVPPPIPFQADPKTIERIKNRLATFDYRF